MTERDTDLVSVQLKSITAEAKQTKRASIRQGKIRGKEKRQLNQLLQRAKCVTKEMAGYVSSSAIAFIPEKLRRIYFTWTEALWCGGNCSKSVLVEPLRVCHHDIIPREIFCCTDYTLAMSKGHFSIRAHQSGGKKELRQDNIFPLITAPTEDTILVTKFVIA